MISVDQLRVLVALQAEDAALWDTEGVRIETAYVQQGLRYLTRAIEGEWTFEQALDAIKDLLDEPTPKNCDHDYSGRCNNIDGSEQIFCRHCGRNLPTAGSPPSDGANAVPEGVGSHDRGEGKQ